MLSIYLGRDPDKVEDMIDCAEIKDIDKLIKAVCEIKDVKKCIKNTRWTTIFTELVTKTMEQYD